jgi:hypothetical protein
LGYQTDYYGTLEFTRLLTDAELQWLTDESSENVPGMKEFRATKQGITYASEKTYDMVGLINWIIEDARKTIEDFGFKGSLHAETDFDPYEFLIEIGSDGFAHQVPCSDCVALNVAKKDPS